MDLGEGHGRDILVAIAVVGGILLALYLYTGTWPPPVVVESNSMMHIDKAEYEQNFGDTRAEDVPYGRFGTIDPGDLVLVKDVEASSDVSTFADGGEDRYGKPGEVIVYFTNAQLRGTPIIHRAMTYVTVDGSGPDRTYTVRWADGWDSSAAERCEGTGAERVCIFDDEGITIPELSLRGEDYDNSGFITQGDNVAGNPRPDQVLGIYDQPVRIEQVQGVARGELPWFGLIKLTLTGNPTSTAEVRDHPYYSTFGAMTAPQDLWVMLVVGLAFVAFAPIGIDYGIHYARRWYEDRREPGDGNPSAGIGDDPPGGSGPGSASSTDQPPPEPNRGREGTGSGEGSDEEATATRPDEDRVEISLD